jgi:hypothetical protein
MATAKKPAGKSSARKPGRPEKKPAAKKKAPEAAKKAEAAAKPTKPAAASKAGAQPAARGAARPPGKEAAAAPVAPARPRAPEAAPAAKRARKGPPRTVAVTIGSAAASKLGTKWNCFQCGAKFYDLGKPQPLCPKCGADQRLRPKVSANAPAQPPAPRRAPRPIAPLLDDEDDGTVRYEEEFDLGVRTESDETDEELFPPGEMDDEEPFEEES